jgi:predicted TIM-barrel fold metal-dependent hydrolase
LSNFNSELLPPLACDAHVHVVGAQSQYPMIEQRQYTAGLATLHDLQAHLSRCGLERAVIVQPSFYGADNRCLLQSLRGLGDQGRGIAVLEEQVGDRQLQRLQQQGIRGVRLNVESSTDKDTQTFAQMLSYWAQRIAPLGWHIQLYAALGVIAALADTIQRLTVDLVLDHFAMTPMHMRLAPSKYAGARNQKDEFEQPELSRLMKLLESGRVWIKLSAPYRPPIAQPEQVRDFSALASEFLKLNPQRILWGSDWPHTQREVGKTRHQISAYRPIAAGSLVQQIHEWLPTAELRQTVLVDNPSALYWTS